MENVAALLDARPAAALSASQRAVLQQTGTASIATAKTDGPARTAKAQHDYFQNLIEAFLHDVRDVAHRTPTEREIEVARAYLNVLEQQTREDHLSSVDELIAQVPTEFMAAIRGLEEAESFVFSCAAGELVQVRRAVDKSWNLPHATDRDGRTGLIAASAMGHLGVVQLLVERGANASTPDYEGFTALHWAVESNSVDVVRFLLTLPDINSAAQTISGKTAKDMVQDLRSKHQPAMLALLERHEEAVKAEAQAKVAATSGSPTKAAGDRARKRKAPKAPTSRPAAGAGGSAGVGRPRPGRALTATPKPAGGSGSSRGGSRRPAASKARA